MVTTWCLALKFAGLVSRAFRGIALREAVHVAVLMNSFPVFISACIGLEIDWLVKAGRRVSLTSSKLFLRSKSVSHSGGSPFEAQNCRKARPSSRSEEHTSELQS